ncbi:MAG TPA: hypothetical protein VGK73_28840 [Polyangiaceae bacterium]
MPLETRVGDIAWKASWALSRDESFDLAGGLAARDLEPLLLGARDRNTSKLTSGGEGDVACPKRLGRGWKLFEHLGDAEFLLREARSVAEESLDVLREGAVAQALVRSASERRKQPTTFLEIEGSSLRGEFEELLMRLFPARIA